MVQVAEKVGAHVTEVKNVIIWGNHSSSQFPDVAHGSVGGTPIKEAVKDEEWLKGDFITTVQQRGAAIIKVRYSRSLLPSHAQSMMSTPVALGKSVEDRKAPGGDSCLNPEESQDISIFSRHDACGIRGCMQTRHVRPLLPGAHVGCREPVHLLMRQ